MLNLTIDSSHSYNTYILALACLDTPLRFDVFHSLVLSGVIIEHMP